MRLSWILGVVVALACVFVPAAAALDFNDGSEEAPEGEVGLIYHFVLRAHGGCDDAPYKFVVDSGLLAPGLTLTPTSVDHAGAIDGIPTEQGTWTAWIALKDYCGGHAELLYTFLIHERRFWIATNALRPATVGAPYSATLETARVRSNVTWTVTKGSLPAGLTLAPNGSIYGTPTAAGASTFTLTATGVSIDPSNAGTRVDSKEFTLTVLGPLSASLSTRTAEVGVPYHASLQATGGQGPYIWSGVSTPGGLSVAADGTVSGVPTSRSSGMTVHLVDANGSEADVRVPLAVRAHVAISTISLRAATVGRAYKAKLAVRGGVAPLRWSLARGRLPLGLRLEARTGTLVGVPRAAGSSRVVVRVRDALGGRSTKTFVLGVHS